MRFLNFTSTFLLLLGVTITALGQQGDSGGYARKKQKERAKRTSNSGRTLILPIRQKNAALSKDSITTQLTLLIK